MPATRSRLPSTELKDLRNFTRKRASSFFIVRSRENRLPHDRVAVIVSVKVDRRSTARHLMKRRVAGYLSLKRQGGKDIVVTVLPPAAALPRKAFLERLEEILTAR